MKKYNPFIFITVVMLSGCVSVSYEKPADSSLSKMAPTEEVLTQIDKIKPGMNYSEVKAVMDKKILIGISGLTDLTSLITEQIESPYKAEVFVSKKENYKILYYFTAIKKPDGIISNDELTPLIFNTKEKLVGIGWDYLFNLKNSR